MARDVIESEFRISGHFVKKSPISDIQNGRRQPFCQKFPKQLKLRIDLKWPEMRSKVNFGHPKWPTAAILSKFPKKLKLRIDLKWPEMRSKVNFGHPKWPTAAILSKNSKKLKLRIDLKWPEMRSKVNFGHPK